MGMREQNVRHCFAAHRVEQGLRMSLVRGARIDDRDVAPADDVAHRSGEREGARIVAQHPPHARNHFVHHTGRERKIPVERNIVDDAQTKTSPVQAYFTKTPECR